MKTGPQKANAIATLNPGISFPSRAQWNTANMINKTYAIKHNCSLWRTVMEKELSALQENSSSYLRQELRPSKAQMCTIFLGK